MLHSGRAGERWGWLVNRTGSIAIASAVFKGSGSAFGATGMVVLVSAAVLHSNVWYAVAALLFGVGLTTLAILARVDRSVMATPWAPIVRWTDIASLVVLAVATFAPLITISFSWLPAWDLAVLAGVLLLWRAALRRLVADRRRIAPALGVVVLAWLPVILLHPSARAIAYVVEVLVAVALAISVISFYRALKGPRTYYRLIPLGRRDNKPSA